MADFALFATACERRLWKQGTFGNVYSDNRVEAVDHVTQTDPFGSAIRSRMASQS